MCSSCNVLFSPHASLAASEWCSSRALTAKSSRQDLASAQPTDARFMVSPNAATSVCPLSTSQRLSPLEEAHKDIDPGVRYLALPRCRSFAVHARTTAVILACETHANNKETCHQHYAHVMQKFVRPCASVGEHAFLSARPRNLLLYTQYVRQP